MKKYNEQKFNQGFTQEELIRARDRGEIPKIDMPLWIKGKTEDKK